MSVNKYGLYFYKFLNLSLCFIRNLRPFWSIQLRIIVICVNKFYNNIYLET